MVLPRWHQLGPRGFFTHTPGPAEPPDGALHLAISLQVLLQAAGPLPVGWPRGPCTSCVALPPLQEAFPGGRCQTSYALALEVPGGATPAFPWSGVPRPAQA